MPWRRSESKGREPREARSTPEGVASPRYAPTPGAPGTALAARAVRAYLPCMSSRRPIRPGIQAHGGNEPEASGLSPHLLREAFSRWASGVTVVAVRDEPYVAAITATAFTPVSIEPPLVLVCIGANATVLPLLEPGARFAISILSEKQRRLASIFADPGPLGREHLEPEGEPLVIGAPVGFACTVRDVHDGGDHAIVVAKIIRLVLGDDAPPLLYHGREYRRLQ